ncbi:MAG: insulinase family protein [Methylobacteriaceae bacterium]|jgi:zinc protease|nr:insulinase family protein [Methylobacteriaceae bacterium]
MSTPSGPTAPASQPAVDVTVLKTPKGQEIWYVHSDVVPLVALSFNFEGGGAHDTPERIGTTMMMASLLDEGAGEYDSETFQDRLAERAIDLSFDASLDAVFGSLRALENHADEAFGLLRLALTKPRFDAPAVERIRSQFISIVRQQQTDPSSIASDLFMAKAFAGHPYAYPTTGTLETIPAITREDLEAAFRRSVRKGRIKIAAAGSLAPERLMRLVDDVFGDLPAEETLTDIPVLMPANRGDIFVSELDVPQSVIRFALKGVPRADPDFIPAYVLNHIFGGGSFTSRLFHEVREKRGLAYNAGSGLSTYRCASLLNGYTATKNERVQECLDVIADVIENLKTDGVTAEELQKAKDYLTGSYLLAFDTSSKIARQLSGLAFEGLGVEYLTERNTLINSVTEADLRRVGERIFADGVLLSVIVGKPRELRKK